MSKKSYVLHLFIFMMVDYLFTYVGIINLGWIQEANPFLVWLFELPFIYGFLIRASYCLMMCGLLEYAYRSNYKHYSKIIFSMLSVNVGVLALHINWVSKFMKAI